ncbi:superoxide dismutase [Cu-Zn], chloroplastic-like [Haliotis rubra]|uniref:superoxide dismutase [Cu-Zn], chloroplastic-like n=1 Tax=Haliotis rubra TaxID=36100 RepID=UPI001EE59D92|nr:superoxide dismutase [Cu-Zn], chloroplastic-like [Haliotis rubra]
MERRHQHHPDHDTYVYGRCDMAMNPTLVDSPHNITGVILFRQKVHKPLEVLIDLEGFSMASMSNHDIQEHGFHVHQFGDLTDGCQSFGGHFDPDDVTHGSPHSDQRHRHAGDWGNIVCDNEGKVHRNLTDHNSNLVGFHSIIGRGIVIHAHKDDLGLGGVPASLKTGNAGPRLACCPIVSSKGVDWEGAQG